MAKIVFNAFSFLQKKLKERNINYVNELMTLPENTTITQLLDLLDIPADEVEGVFINGRVKDFETTLSDGDRVAIFPPGTPGPHRLLLGIKKHPDSL